MTGEVIIVALVAVVLGAVLKSISGVGVPLVTIPAISYVADVETAVVVTVLPNLALNLALAWREREHRNETRDLPSLAVAGFIGAVAGTLLLVSVSDEPLIVLLACIVVLYAVGYFLKPDFAIGPERSRIWSPVVGLVAGLMQGSVSISAPVLVPWVHSFRLRRDAHVLSVTALFAVAGLAQLPTLAISGALTDGGPAKLMVAAAACGPALATIPVGERLRNAVSSKGFDRFVVLTLVASVIGLVVRRVLL
jgi:uncharacterized membrane protein YfcA